MTDRLSTKPGRVLLTPEGGSAPFYAILARADGPIRQGTPWSKNSVLRDETAAALGLDPESDPAPDDAFAGIAADISALLLRTSPSLWPKDGSEVDLGDGTYGRWYEGTQNALSVTLDLISGDIWGSHWNIVDSGGYWSIIEFGGFPLGYYLVSDGVITSKFEIAGQYRGSVGRLRATFLTTSVASGYGKYFIWVRYRKSL